MIVKVEKVGSKDKVYLQFKNGQSFRIAKRGMSAELLKEALESAVANEQERGGVSIEEWTIRNKKHMSSRLFDGIRATSFELRADSDRHPFPKDRQLVNLVVEDDIMRVRNMGIGTWHEFKRLRDRHD